MPIDSKFTKNYRNLVGLTLIEGSTLIPDPIKEPAFSRALLPLYQKAENSAQAHDNQFTDIVEKRQN
jgi:hypothetical protein